MLDLVAGAGKPKLRLGRPRWHRLQEALIKLTFAGSGVLRLVEAKCL